VSNYTRENILKDFTHLWVNKPLLCVLKNSLQSFEWLSYNHIFRELNEKSNSLSKEALSLPMGALGFYEFLDNEEKKYMEF
jgi:hypothetical protein